MARAWRRNPSGILVRIVNADIGSKSALVSGKTLINSSVSFRPKGEIMQHIVSDDTAEIRFQPIGHKSLALEMTH